MIIVFALSFRWLSFTRTKLHRCVDCTHFTPVRAKKLPQCVPGAIRRAPYRCDPWSAVMMVRRGFLIAANE
uniref:Putative secreted protein n=1 Tax=Anopheles marajoara TaxID=58244 RepID=A0A2M4CEF5_9DIPT